MRYRLLSALTALAFLAAASGTTGTQDVLLDIRRRSDELADRDSTPEFASLLLKTISTNADKLGQLLEERQLTEFYLESLRVNASVLGSLLRAPDANVTDRVRSVADDLAVKVVFAAKNPESPDRVQVVLRATEPGSLYWQGHAGADEPRYEIAGGRGVELPPGLILFGNEDGGRPVLRDVGGNGESRVIFELDDLNPRRFLGMRRQAGEVLLANCETSARIVRTIEPHEWLTELEDNLGRLKELNQHDARTVIPEDYSDLMQAVHATLSEIAQDGRISDRERETLSALARQIGSLVGRSENEGGWPDKITVFVRTLGTNQNPVQGLEVLFMAPGFHNRERQRPDKLYQFPRWSSPTWHDVLPVDWYMWTRYPNQGERRGEAKLLNLSTELSPHVVVDLPVPPR